MPRRRGFTLLELLTALIIVSVLATIAIMRFSRTKEKGHLAAMQSDLRTLVAAQEMFRSDSARYTSDPGQLPLLRTSPQVQVTITQADAGSWRATATHPATTVVCTAVGGAAAGGTAEVHCP